MKETLTILIVDDHPTMIEGYKSILFSKYDENKLNIFSAFDCRSGYKSVNERLQPFDVVLLDINLPPCENLKLDSGEDLAFFISKKFPQTKIMMLTSHTETFLLYNLIKKLNPDGVLIKSDFNAMEMLNAFNAVLNGETYYTTTAKQSLKSIYTENNYLDAYNRRIISLLAKGIATKNLPSHLNITISAIDKRKAYIKDFFNIDKGNDEDIIREARKRGFI